MNTRWAVRSGLAFDGTSFLPGGATVVVEADRIVGVEPAAYDLPDDVPVTELPGTLLPGLVDCHAHLVSAGELPGMPGSLEWAGTAPGAAVDAVVTASLQAQVSAGVTTVRDLGDVDFRVLAHRGREREGLPRIVASGPPITTIAGHCHFLGGGVEPDDPASLDRAIAERVERGVDVVKVMASGGFLTPGTDQLGAQFEVQSLRRLVDAAHAAGLRVVAHAHSVVGATVAIEARVDGIEHFSNLAEGHVGATDAMLDSVAASGITIDPTLGRDPARFAPLIAAPPPHVVEMMARVGIADPREHFANLAGQARRLREHGIRVVSGLDSGAMVAKRHGQLWRAVDELVAGGWPVDEAVATATATAADECGVEAGRLEPGLHADLLVVDGDVAADVTALGRPVSVWVGGVAVASAHPHPG